jgi:hypothetical protein
LIFILTQIETKAEISREQTRKKAWHKNSAQEADFLTLPANKREPLANEIKLSAKIS